MSLPQKLTWDMAQTKWASEINPVLAQPLNSAGYLKGIELISGVTTINHLLGRTMQGWIISDINGAAAIYRSKPFNDLTLTLTSNAPVTVNLVVF